MIKRRNCRRHTINSLLNLLEIRCLEKINKYGLHQQAEINFRIRMMQHEQELAQSIIDEAKAELFSFMKG